MDLARLAQKKQRGITLLELMIVVGVIGILAAIGYPSYIDQVRRSNRAEGKTALQNIAALEEKYFSNNNTYGTAAQLGIATTTEKGYYAITITPATPTTTYTITATKAGGQSGDNRCVTMTLTNAGVKGGSGSQCDCATAATCW
jgi:type IV pilus assembly protein PilE